MGRSSYEANNRKFEPFDLNPKEWHIAKYQMKLMEEHVLQKSEFIDVFKEPYKHIIKYISKLDSPSNFSLENLELTEEDYKNIEPYWQIISYILKTQLSFCIKLSNKNHFLMNLPMKGYSKDEIECLKILISIFTLKHGTNTIDKIKILYGNDFISQSEFRNLPNIHIISKQTELNSCLKVLNDTIMTESNGAFLVAEKFPLLISNSNYIYDRVYNVDISKECIHKLLNEEVICSLKKTRDVIDFTFSKIKKEAEDSFFIYMPKYDLYAVIQMLLTRDFKLSKQEKRSMLSHFKFIIKENEKYVLSLAHILSTLLSDRIIIDDNLQEESIVDNVISGFIASVSDQETRCYNILKIVARKLYDEYNNREIFNYDRTHLKPFLYKRDKMEQFDIAMSCRKDDAVFYKYITSIDDESFKELSKKDFDKIIEIACSYDLLVKDKEKNPTYNVKIDEKSVRCHLFSVNNLISFVETQQR